MPDSSTDIRPRQASSVAIVHDFLLSYGGAERVLESFARKYPDAPIYTLLADEKIVRRSFPGREIRTSFLQRLPRFIRRRYRLLLPLYPIAVETFDFRDFDLVVSSSGAWSKGAVTRTMTTHVAYLHSPTRYLWDANESYLRRARIGGVRAFFGRVLLSYLRIWDREAALRPDVLVANSRYTAERIRKYYRRDAAVLHPPVTFEPDTDAGPRGDFFLVVARLTESKGVDVAVEAFAKLDLPLVVVGRGDELSRLKRLAGPRTVFRGFVGDRTLARLYATARAVIVPSEEDFGLAAAEAVISGTPVITINRGGSKEILTSGVTGRFYDADTPEVLADAVRRFLDEPLSDAPARPDAGRFSESAFLDGWDCILGTREQ